MKYGKILLLHLIQGRKLYETCSFPATGELKVILIQSITMGTQNHEDMVCYLLSSDLCMAFQLVRHMT